MSWIEIDVAGTRRRVAIVRSGAGAWVAWNGLVQFVESERSSSASRVETERDVRAPMTGRVVKVHATAGATVRANEVLVILEAMKMEYRLVAPRDGVVESVGCREGDRVDLGRVLVVLAS